MGKLTFQRANDYDPLVHKVDPNDIEGYFDKVTEPGQAVSVKKLYERYKKGSRGTWKDV